MKFVISDGREIDVNPYLISLEEYRAITKSKKPQPEEDVIMARVFGISVDEYVNLPEPDWNWLTYNFLKLCSTPTEPPNSASGSTSTLSTDKERP